MQRGGSSRKRRSASESRRGSKKTRARGFDPAAFTVEPEWWREYFGADYYLTYAEHQGDEISRIEAAAIADLLSLEIGDTVLDVCCGWGRHAIELGTLGYRVTGIDQSEFLLGIAVDQARDRGVDVRFLQKDVRALTYDREYDAAFNFFTSFGYFSDAENTAMLAGIARSLKEDGRFLIELINREWLEQNFRPYDREFGNGYSLESERFLTSDGHVLQEDRLTRTDGSQHTYRYILRTYHVAELCALLEDTGFEVRDVVESGTLEDVGPESVRILICADLCC